MVLKRRLPVLLAAALIAAVVILYAVQAQAQDTGTQRFIYTGTSTMTVQLTNVYGQNTTVETYQTPFEVVLRVPSPYARDPNPFFLAAQSKPLVNDPGEASLLSTAPVDTDPTTGEKIVLRMWTLRILQDQGPVGEFDGRLTDNRFNEALSGANAIAIPINYAPNLTQVMPQAMANGTQMSGTVTQNEFRAQVEGNTTDQTHPFRITIVATRSG
jgi:hypothetical protein